MQFFVFFLNMLVVFLVVKYEILHFTNHPLPFSRYRVRFLLGNFFGINIYVSTFL